MTGRRTVAAVVAFATLAAACGGGSGGESAEGDPSEASSEYGFGPQDDGSVTYQDDVVLIEDGPGAIEAMSDDGLTWTLDAGADGVDELEVGSVMFASSAAAGRVLELDRRGDSVEVRLAPVELTEVIRDAQLELDEQVSIDSFSFREIPDMPGALEDSGSDVAGGGDNAAAPLAGDDELVLVLPEVELIASGDATRAAADGPAEVTTNIGGWEVGAYRKAGVLGLKASHGVKAGSAETGLKVELDAHIEVADLQITADVPITRGVVGNSEFKVEGITGLDVSIQGGAGNGLSDNRKVKVEIPVQLTKPVIVGGFPAMLTQKFKFLVETAFTAQNGNLSASGSWSVDGPLGFDGSTLSTPKLAERGTSVLDSLEGVSVGVNGVVVAVAFEFGLLFGVPVAGSGPVASLVLSLGLTNGSDLGIVKCRQVTVTGTLTAGVALVVYEPVRNELKKRGIDIPKQTTLITETIVQESGYVPRVQACKL